MANHQIDITENGKKTLKTAQKYCDRDIEVNVDVPSSGGAQPTQFTNILNLATTIVKNEYRCVSSGYTATTHCVAIVCYCQKGTHKLRVRGKYAFGFLQRCTFANSYPTFYQNLYQADGTPTESTFSGTNIHSDSKDDVINTDEHGDFYIEFTTTADGYIGFNLKDMSVLYPSGTFSEPIVTIDEPIGNGGVV